MKEIKVSIEGALSDYIERLFFEYNKELDILTFLCSQDDIHKEYLDLYYKEAEQKGIKLELVKLQARDAYAPCPLSDIINFYFDFENYLIIFKVKD